jgi:hypothetical protein
MVIWKAFPDNMDNHAIYSTSKQYNYCAHFHCNKRIIDFHDCRTRGQNAKKGERKKDLKLEGLM